MGHCEWANTDNITKIYHDSEWGVPVHDDKVMFEHLSLECLQCGLSWNLMMKKREIFRKCFDNFNYESIANFNENDINKIMNTAGMLKSLNKIKAIINNAKCFKKVREEFGSFCEYIWAYSDNKSIIYEGHSEGKIPVSNGLSKRISKDLKKRGFKYIGEITIYSHLQACGIINDHASDCPRFKIINKNYPIIKIKPDNDIYN